MTPQEPSAASGTRAPAATAPVAPSVEELVDHAARHNRSTSVTYRLYDDTWLVRAWLNLNDIGIYEIDPNLARAMTRVWNRIEKDA